jgi:7-keto-8-aminopelargonate synthetase-like enzyme
MDSDHPDFSRVIEICRSYDASLLVDVAHDLGVLGPMGRGVLHEPGVSGKPTFVIGSFSKTFGCIGGFFASNSRAASYYVRGFSGAYTFSNYLVPPQIAAVRSAVKIVSSPQGDSLRSHVLSLSTLMRTTLASLGIKVLGRPSPIVLPFIGPEKLARKAYRYCLQNGVILNSVEFPACRKAEARFRLQITPRHSHEDVVFASNVIADSVSSAAAD